MRPAVLLLAAALSGCTGTVAVVDDEGPSRSDPTGPLYCPLEADVGCPPGDGVPGDGSVVLLDVDAGAGGHETTVMEPVAIDAARTEERPEP